MPKTSSVIATVKTSSLDASSRLVSRQPQVVPLSRDAASISTSTSSTPEGGAVVAHEVVKMARGAPEHPLDVGRYVRRLPRFV